MVCRDEASARSDFGITNTAGNFTGGLADDGERITLVDRPGGWSTRSATRTPASGPSAPTTWATASRRSSRGAPSDDPASWMDSGRWTSGSRRSGSPHGPGSATSSRLYFYLEAAGEFLLDDISLVNVAIPREPAPQSDLHDRDLARVVRRDQSRRWSQSAGRDLFEEPALHLIATGGDAGAATPSPSTRRALARPGPDYRLTFRYLHVSGARASSRASRVERPAASTGSSSGAPGGAVTPGGDQHCRGGARPAVREPRRRGRP